MKANPWQCDAENGPAAHHFRGPPLLRRHPPKTDRRHVDLHERSRAAPPTRFDGTQSVFEMDRPGRGRSDQCIRHSGRLSLGYVRTSLTGPGSVGPVPVGASEWALPAGNILDSSSGIEHVRFVGGLDRSGDRLPPDNRAAGLDGTLFRAPSRGLVPCQLLFRSLEPELIGSQASRGRTEGDRRGYARRWGDVGRAPGGGVTKHGARLQLGEGRTVHGHRPLICVHRGLICRHGGRGTTCGHYRDGDAEARQNSPHSVSVSQSVERDCQLSAMTADGTVAPRTPTLPPRRHRRGLQQAPQSVPEFRPHQWEWTPRTPLRANG
jgi:hypothetical protein